MRKRSRRGAKTQRRCSGKATVSCLATKRHCIEQIQAYFSDVPSDISLVDELIAERREEVACE